MTHFETMRAFIADDPVRRSPVRDWRGVWLENGLWHRISYIPSTHEVFATIASNPDGPVELLGTVESWELARALLSRSDHEPPLAWARERIRNAPFDPAQVEAAIGAAEAARRAWDDAARRDARASLGIVALADLPNPDAGLEHAAADERRCKVCGAGDWKAIASASVRILEQAVDPLDRHAVRRAAREVLQREEDIEELYGLFLRPIEVRRGEFLNGRHRTHALRRIGAEHVVASIRE